MLSVRGLGPGGRGRQIIIFAGETDAAVPYVGSETWTRMLGQPLLEDWHAWHVNDQVEGYAVTYENLQFVTFKGGWHTGAAPLPASGRWLDRSSG